jgi:cadmium resistance transport/sequestration family protein
MISAIITTIVAFVSTNIDDIFILMIFFSQLEKGVQKTNIILGQFLGIGCLTIISIIGAMGVSVLPNQWIGLLGIVPIAMGIKAHREYKRNTASISKVDFIKPSILKIFSITVANGGDNIGIYTPIYASMNFLQISISAIVITLLTGVWCYLGLHLSKHILLQSIIEKYEHILVPVVFIGLGLYIIIKSGLFDCIQHFICL